jgi:leader peptidase (prepilin peptidase) / N-methyltransferase
MQSTNTLHAVITLWPWLIAGAWLGSTIPSLSQAISLKVLLHAKVDLNEWKGPGGGLTAPHFRQGFQVSFGFAALHAALWLWLAMQLSTNGAEWLRLLVWCTFASVLVLLAHIDWHTTLLPDVITLPLIALGVIASSMGFTHLTWESSVGSGLLLLLGVGGFSWLYQRVRHQSGMGMGDLKLLTALATWLGATQTLYILLCACLLTVLWYFVWVQLKKLEPGQEWPFGPSIAIAAIAWMA